MRHPRRDRRERCRVPRSLGRASHSRWDARSQSRANPLHAEGKQGGHRTRPVVAQDESTHVSDHRRRTFSTFPDVESPVKSTVSIESGAHVSEPRRRPPLHGLRGHVRGSSTPRTSCPRQAGRTSAGRGREPAETGTASSLAFIRERTWDREAGPEPCEVAPIFVGCPSRIAWDTTAYPRERRWFSVNSQPAGRTAFPHL